ncbi:MAG: hypothetical protein ACTSVL_06290 [Promethearchaeota archaeon]
MGEEQSVGFKRDVYDRLVKKMNKFLMDEELKAELEYFFEPNDEKQHEAIFEFHFHYPSMKKILKKILWNPFRHKKSIPLEIPERDYAEMTIKSMQEMLNVLEEVEERVKIRNRNIKLPFVDRFEDETNYIIQLEIPHIEEHQLELRASPHEVEIIAGETFQKVIYIIPRINPDTALANYDEKKNIVELKFKKILKKPKSKIQIHKK